VHTNESIQRKLSKDVFCEKKSDGALSLDIGVPGQSRMSDGFGTKEHPSKETTMDMQESLRIAKL
jgi:hypothetical protein